MKDYEHEDVTELIKALNDADRNVRVAATKVLSQRDEVGSLPALAAAVCDDDPTVRKLAAGPIVKWLTDGSPFLRTAAATALMKWAPTVPANVLTALENASSDPEAAVRLAADLAVQRVKSR